MLTQIAKFDKKTVIAGAVILVLLVLYFLAKNLLFHGVPVTVGPEEGVISINAMGMYITLQEVNGKDLSCIGRPEGYKRVYFSSEEDDYGKYITLGYAKAGDEAEKVRDWVYNKANECGFTKKVSETSGAYMNARGYSLEFSDDKDTKRLAVDIAVVKGSDGKDYTLVRIVREDYKEVSGEENSEEGSTASQGGEETPQQDVPVTGALADANNYVKGILGNVIGKAVLTYAYGDQSNMYLTYETEKTLSAEDVQKITDYMTNQGYQQIGSEAGEGAVNLGFQKGSEILVFQITPNDNTLSVTVMNFGQRE